jgi:uncharacterized lipoprotein YehR (DUF1307 family)
MDSPSPNHTVDNDETQLDQIAAVLEQLPEKTKSLRERVTYLHSSIQETLDKGYSYAEVATLLKQEGILISVSTLKQYMKRSATTIEESTDEIDNPPSRAVKAKDRSAKHHITINQNL